MTDLQYQHKALKLLEVLEDLTDKEERIKYTAFTLHRFYEVGYEDGYKGLFLDTLEEEKRAL